jgi:hypothetical protein
LQIAISVLIAWVVVGCADKALPMVPVAGTLHHHGIPLGGVLVRFWPKDAALQAKINPPEATTDADGRFQLSCPPGQYKVTVLVPPAPGGPPPGKVDNLVVPAAGAGNISSPGTFADRILTPLEVEIKASANDDVTLTIP